MRLPVFAEAIRRCDAALKPHNIDIVNILTSKDKTIFNNILNSFVGIAAIQVNLSNYVLPLLLIFYKIYLNANDCTRKQIFTQISLFDQLSADLIINILTVF
jgi:hypothetical protein